jgi:hypothetical protein
MEAALRAAVADFLRNEGYELYDWDCYLIPRSGAAYMWVMPGDVGVHLQSDSPMCVLLKEDREPYALVARLDYGDPDFLDRLREGVRAEASAGSI